MYPRYVERRIRENLTDTRVVLLCGPVGFVRDFDKAVIDEVQRAPRLMLALKRLIKSPKLQFLDSGLLAALRGLTPERARRNRAPLGVIVETFALSELLKIASWAEERYRFSYFRDKDGNEVDIVIEDEQGRVIGIEAKSSATVSRSDFSGLRRLAAASGDQFVMGLILCDHEQTVPFGNQFAAAPIASLWS